MTTSIQRLLATFAPSYPHFYKYISYTQSREYWVVRNRYSPLWRLPLCQFAIANEFLGIIGKSPHSSPKIIIRGNSCIILYISMFGHQQYLTHELLPLVPTLTQEHISIHSDHTRIQWVVTILIQVYVSICLRHTQACILETTAGS